MCIDYQSIYYGKRYSRYGGLGGSQQVQQCHRFTSSFLRVSILKKQQHRQDLCLVPCNVLCISELNEWPLKLKLLTSYPKLATFCNAQEVCNAESYSPLIFKSGCRQIFDKYRQ